MNIVEQYKRYAEEAIEKSRAATDAIVKREWQRISEEWAALAEARLLVLSQGSAKH